MKKQSTVMQKAFKGDMIRPLIAILYPEFADIVNEFYISFSFKYTWVIVNAVRPAHYVGIKPTKKELKAGIRDERELIEQSYHLDFGINNHHGSGLWGPITKQRVEEVMHLITIDVWKFAYSYNVDIKFTDKQKEDTITYLTSRGITKPTVDEFYEQYYSK